MKPHHSKIAHLMPDFSACVFLFIFHFLTTLPDQVSRTELHRMWRNMDLLWRIQSEIIWFAAYPEDMPLFSERTMGSASRCHGNEPDSP